MKKLIVFSMLLFLAQFVHAQTDALDKFMSRFKGKEGVMKMSFNGSFDFGNDKTQGFNFKSASSKIKGVRLFILDEKAHVQNTDFQSLVNDMKRAKFDDLMTIRKGGDRVHFMGRETDKGYTDITFLTKDDKGGAFLMCLEGFFTKHDIENMTKENKP
ncbi:MAG: DUF4252 domain-containing protein [Saprospiraceae bacterium]|nr:DUF4252 domain-containing protein [Saprospiraceae bacterium]